MKTTIVVAGATGNLGGRVVKALIKKGAAVTALVRTDTQQAKIDKLAQSGAEIIRVDMTDEAGIKAAITGSSCVVSTLAGLHNIIVDMQNILLNAAVAAGIPRFIPSDFSTDFTKLAIGDNRNFDLRKQFKDIIDTSGIQATSIFNGAFAEVLRYDMPFLNRKSNTVGFLESADRFVEFTTMSNTAEFTAAAALDASSPRELRIASFQVTANDMSAAASVVFNAEFKTVPMGGLEHLALKNKVDRSADPEGENQLYPKWQTSQYFFSMFSVLNESLDNERYPDIDWTSLQEYLEMIK